MPFGTGNRITVLLLFMVAALAFALITAVENGAEGNIITVDDDGGADYLKIQDAINASEDGDTIFVYNGNYTENIKVNHSIVLEGENRTGVNLEGAGGLDVILVNNTFHVTIRNFTIRGSDTSIGNGLTVNNSDHVKISWLSISDCHDGILVNNSLLCTIENVTSEDNHDSGIKVTESGDISIMDSECYGCNIGINISHSSDCMIGNCTLGDVGKGNKHGIYLMRTNRTLITDSAINDNQVMGIYNYLANHTTIINNCLERDDIAIKDHYSNNTNPDISMNNTFYGNTYANYYPMINQAPEAHLRANTTPAGIGESISFDASASNDRNDDTPVEWYRVDFGDGYVTEWVTEPYFNHSYDREGKYQARLYVMDSLFLESEHPDEMEITIENKEGENGDGGSHRVIVTALLGLIAILSLTIVFIAKRKMD